MAGAGPPKLAERSRRGARLGCEQSAVYEAEARSIDTLGCRWRRITDAQRYVDGLVASMWFFEQWPHFVRCTVERRATGARWSTCVPFGHDGPGGLATEGAILVAGGLTQATILHELAHLLVPADAGHGREFVDTLLVLVRHEMGVYAYAELRAALRT